MLQVNASAQWNSNYITKSKTHMKQSAKSITEGLSHNKDHFELETQNTKQGSCDLDLPEYFHFSCLEFTY